ncbi:hypothetical protein BDQ94DRAFT_157979 [Aspergillus welwitschiae]|uniref:Uncharacterized protein n=1 Tax=Aspergillus welwitschiae TaxID=1341132 RepID=A0A3F3Q9F6_9EURO|nr:hypothetical protein BDQ94DRAFT_157979 [Aspergillus welwitschiae]RDH35799.1 hypothetical protein BDQ94DRAFT_157979 [Aspergillus welwitschiae]
MAKALGDWPIARRARRHLGTPRSRSLPVRGRFLPQSFHSLQNSTVCLTPSRTRTKSFVPSVGPPYAEHGARMVGTLCAISPAHATDDQQQTVATSGFPAPWLTRWLTLYGAHDVACLGHSGAYLPQFLSDVRWKNVASEAIVPFDQDGGKDGIMTASDPTADAHGATVLVETRETFLIGGGVHSRPAQAAQNRSKAELPGLIIRAIVWSSGIRQSLGQQSAEGARPVQVKYPDPLRTPPDAARARPGAKPSGFEALSISLFEMVCTAAYWASNNALLLLR